MKKILIILLLSIAVIPCEFSSAYAEDVTFFRVINEETPFFSDENLTDVLFYLPYTYYVKILETKNGIAHIEWNGSGTELIDGYTYLSMLFNDNQKVDSPYLNLKITTSNTASLYLDKEKTSQIQYVFKNRTLNYYGFYQSETEFLYYVSYNGKLGYVEEEFINPFSVQNHPNPLTFLTPEKEETPPKENGENYVGIRWAIISCFILASGLGVYAAFKGKQKKSDKSGYYDESDFG